MISLWNNLLNLHDFLRSVPSDDHSCMTSCPSRYITVQCSHYARWRGTMLVEVVRSGGNRERGGARKGREGDVRNQPMKNISYKWCSDICIVMFEPHIRAIPLKCGEGVKILKKVVGGSKISFPLPVFKWNSPNYNCGR